MADGLLANIAGLMSFAWPP